jgi:hypothetical protein
MLYSGFIQWRIAMLTENIKKVFAIRWHSGSDFTAVIVSWFLVVGALYTTTVVVGSDAGGGISYFLLYAVLGAGIFGVGIPLYWTVVVRKRPLSDIGITTRWLWLSLILQIIFAAIQYAGTMAKGRIPELRNFLPLLTLALAIGFF